MTHEECFFVVIGVYEPTGDVVGIGGCEVARGGVKNVYAFYCHLDGVFCGAGEGDVGFAEQHEEAVVFAGFESFRQECLANCPTAMFYLSMKIIWAIGFQYH